MRAMALDRSENSFRLLVDILSMLIRFGLLICLYYYFFEWNGGNVLGQDLKTVSWSFFFYFIFIMLNFRHVSRTMSREVNTGRVEMFLNKPYNYLLYKFSENLGNKFFPFLFNLLAMGSFMYLLFGFLPIMKSWLFVLTFPVTFILCVFLSYLIFAIIGILSFFIEDIMPIQWIIDKFIMVLGGSFLPVAFFPSYMKTLAIWTPFGASQFITHTVYDSWKTDWVKLVSIQLFWVLVLFCVMHLLYSLAIKKTSINGG